MSKIEVPQKLQLVDAAVICARLGICTRTLRCWIKEGKFPRPDLVIGQRYRRWQTHTLALWEEGSKPRPQAGALAPRG